MCRKKQDFKEKKIVEEVGEIPNIEFVKAEGATVTKPLEETNSGIGLDVELGVPSQDKHIVEEIQESQLGSDSEISREPNIV